MGEKQTITGAFGYSGRVIAELLQEDGATVGTLTNSHKPGLDAETGFEVHPLCFDDPDRLAQSLRGTQVLFNTYWVRFNHKRFSQAHAVRNTKILFDAAKRAGVARIVHVSITNPCSESPFEYFRGKAELEQALVETGIPYSILRPAVLFGDGDILLNNIAWTLRRLPLFGLFGDGAYRLQPIHVRDFAKLAISCAKHDGCEIVQAIGPETWTYRALVNELAQILNLRRVVVGMPHRLAHAAGWLFGHLTGDVMITREEIGALMADLLYVDAPPAGTTRLSDWARQHAANLGRNYASELARRTAR